MPQKVFFIGDMVRRTRESAHTLRYYEAIGVLPKAKRSAGGYRVYTHESIERIRFIRKAQSLGLSLHEIRYVFQLKDSGRQPCYYLKDILQDRLRKFSTHVRKLRSLESRIRFVLSKDGVARQRVKNLAVYRQIAQQSFSQKPVRYKISKVEN